MRPIQIVYRHTSPTVHKELVQASRLNVGVGQDSFHAFLFYFALFSLGTLTLLWIVVTSMGRYMTGV